MRRPSALRWSGCKTFEGVLNYSRNAEVAQLVEHHLAMVRVAGSNPVFRSDPGRWHRRVGDMAEWLGKGLQNPVPRFDSGCRLSEGVCRRAISSGGERLPDTEEVSGSNPLSPTILVAVGQHLPNIRDMFHDS